MALRFRVFGFVALAAPVVACGAGAESTQVDGAATVVAADGSGGAGGEGGGDRAPTGGRGGNEGTGDGAPDAVLNWMDEGLWVLPNLGY